LKHTEIPDVISRRVPITGASHSDAWERVFGQCTRATSSKNHSRSPRAELHVRYLMGNLNVETFDFRSFTAALARARKAYRTHCAPTQYLWSGPHADRVVKSLTNSNYYTTWRREPTTEPQRNGREVAFYHAIEW